MNWNLTERDIVLAIDGQSDKRISEQLDKKLLDFINSIQVKQIEDFHARNYMSFDNFENLQKIKMEKMKRVALE